MKIGGLVVEHCFEQQKMRLALRNSREVADQLLSIRCCWMGAQSLPRSTRITFGKIEGCPEFTCSTQPIRPK